MSYICYVHNWSNPHHSCPMCEIPDSMAHSLDISEPRPVLGLLSDYKEQVATLKAEVEQYKKAAHEWEMNWASQRAENVELREVLSLARLEIEAHTASRVYTAERAGFLASLKRRMAALQNAAKLPDDPEEYVQKLRSEWDKQDEGDV